MFFNKLISKWFPDSNGKANSALFIGFGLGGVVFNQVR